MKAKVIHIITKLELGGAQQNTLYTVEHLDRERFEVALWAGGGGILNDDAEKLEDVDFTIVPELVREIRPARDFAALWQLYTMLRDEVRFSEVPVIVHTHSSKAGILGRWAAKLAGVKHIVHSYHGFGFNDFQGWPVRTAFVLAEKVTRRATHEFIAVSRANMDKAVALGLAPEDSIRVIRSGIDISMFEKKDIDVSAKKMDLGIPADAPVALMVACMKPQKNPVDFVRLAEEVTKEVPEARFVAAGDGVLREEMEKAIQGRGLGDRAILLGWRRDVEELMWSSDVLVLTSLWEGLPRVFPQAMAAALPVVGTRVDGGPEAIEDGVNGWLFPPGDVHGMAGKVAELLRSPELARQMGEAGRARVREFDIDLMVRQQEELYEKMLEHRLNSR